MYFEPETTHRDRFAHISFIYENDGDGRKRKEKL